MLNIRGERRISHGTAVQMAIKQAQVNNRAFLNSTSPAPTNLAMGAKTMAPTQSHATETGSHVYEVASNDSIVALRAGDRMLVIDHADAKTSEFVQSVDAVMHEAYQLRSNAPPWELETRIGKTEATLKVHMDVANKLTMTYRSNASASPVPVDPIGRLDWKLPDSPM